MVDPRPITGSDIFNLPFLAVGTTTPRDLTHRFANEMNVKDFGAIGDGAADDTAALQAAINASLVNKTGLYLPPGMYNITSGLTIADVNINGTFGSVRGWSMRGSNDTGDAYNCGSSIRYVGTSTINAVITCNAWRQALLQDFGVLGNAKATYGILMPDSTAGDNRFIRLSVRDCGTAFALQYITGANSEYFLFQNCIVYRVNCFYFQGSGQAYSHCFIDCNCNLNSGGTYFNMDCTGAGGSGGGLYVWNFNGTGIFASGADHTNTTLLRNNNNTSCISFIGGRVEHLTRLYYQPGGAPQAKISPTFKAMEFPSCENNPASSFNTLKSFIFVGGSNFDSLSIENCHVIGYTNNFHPGTYDVLNYAGDGNTIQYWQGFVEWRNCQFVGFVGPATPTPDNYNPAVSLPQNVRFIGCHTSEPSALGQYRDYLLDGIGSFTDLSGFSPPVTQWAMRQPTEPSSTDLGYYTTLLNALNAAGLFAKLDALYILAAPYAANALVNVIQAQFPLTPQNAPTFTAYRGYTFNGSNQYLLSPYISSFAVAGGRWTQPPFAPPYSSQFQLNSASFFVWSLTAASSSGAAFGTGSGGIQRTFFYPRLGTNQYFATINSGLDNILGASTDGSGLWHVSRTSSGGGKVYRNGAVLQTFVEASDITEGDKFTIGLGDLTHFYAGQIAVAGWGAGLNDTDATNLYNTLQAYLHSVGAV